MNNAQSFSPTVSLGVPVRNGEKFLQITLDSIAAQTYQDYEVIISDNGSTDGTAAICNRYAASDSRVRYIRAEENNGAAWNFCNVAKAARGKYFKWLAHDDPIQPEYLERCVAVLESRPEVVLCFTDQVDIDEHGNQLPSKYHSHIPRDKRAVSPRPSERFRKMVKLDYRCEEVFGLIRTEVLMKTKLIEAYTDSDRTLLVELCLYGPFHMVPEILFLHRIHKASSTEVFEDWQERAVWFDPKMAGKASFPFWRQFREYFLFIFRIPMPIRDRLMCLFWLSYWLYSFKRFLAHELVKNLRTPVVKSALEKA
ncbi:MAG: glycosyltransferase family 2 protein [Bacteroidetes bacterium]|nr:glycosyltransferase family 2 protein [Bacteroidota bacterium]